MPDVQSTTTVFTNYQVVLRPGLIYSWENITAASTENNYGAACKFQSLSNQQTIGVTHFLKCSNLATTIPVPTYLVTGLTLRIKRKRYNVTAPGFNLSIFDETVRFEHSGGALSENKADTGTNYPADYEFKQYGHSQDQWGMDLRNINLFNNFSLLVACTINSNVQFPVGAGNIDYIELTIWWESEMPANKSRVFLIT